MSTLTTSVDILKSVLFYICKHFSSKSLLQQTDCDLLHCLNKMDTQSNCELASSMALSSACKDVCYLSLLWGQCGEDASGGGCWDWPEFEQLCC